ncbi:MAG: DUF2752 domain-containing protein [Muribaculaceae bacterium]|nr:DUF2752 domain-containing protein [Muribaculaceae bacterium]
MSVADKPKKRLTATVIAVIAVIAAVIFYAAVDPSSTRWAPRCMLRSLTGYDCPGCGLQRAVHALLHGDIAAVWHYNPFLFFLLPVGTAYSVIELTDNRFPRLRRIMFAPATLIALCVVTIAWWIGRNL